MLSPRKIHSDRVDLIRTSYRPGRRVVVEIYKDLDGYAALRCTETAVVVFELRSEANDEPVAL